jgi:hypothetical protein
LGKSTIGATCIDVCIIAETQEKERGGVSAAIFCCCPVSRHRRLYPDNTGAGGYAGGRAAGTGAADDGSADRTLLDNAHRSHLETAQRRQEAQKGAQGRREILKANESREKASQEEASHQGREGLEALGAGLDKDGIAGEARAGFGSSRLAGACYARAGNALVGNASCADSSGPEPAIGRNALIA